MFPKKPWNLVYEVAWWWPEAECVNIRRLRPKVKEL